MEVIFNHQFVLSDTVQLSPDNRAFSYGDGLFESMLIRDGSCPLLPYHYRRLQKGMGILQMDMPFSEKELESHIRQLAEARHHPLLRMRLQVWRKEGGLYAPEQKECEFLLTASPYMKVGLQKKINAAFSDKVQLSYSVYSGLKTMNALPYVLAGLERKERGLDELILCDLNGQVAECSSSNIFWFQQGRWYTPSLESGCIAGVMRAYLLDQMQLRNIPCTEVLLPKAELLKAELLLACNAMGIRPVSKLENKTFPDAKIILEQLIPLPGL